jgi:hypothetical protein
MPIKYGEITIIRNLEKETMFNYFNRILIGNENSTNDNDTIIILFDDGIICDVKKECTNIKFHKLMEMGPIRGYSILPIYFEIEDKNQLFFSKTPYGNSGIKKLDFKPIFANNKKHITTTKEASVYNCIFEKGNNQVLSILKIKSNEEKPRFLLAYDDESFEKDEIIYFVNYIFSISSISSFAL